jgi:ketosteroid isomerase-like protein
MIDSTHDKIVDEIKIAYDRLTGHSAQADVGQFLRYYQDCPEFTHVSGEGRMSSHAEFERLCSAYYNALERQSIDTLQQRIDVLDAHIAVVAWTGNIRAALKNGDVILMTNYSVTSVFRKIDNAWKIIHAHESCPPPCVVKKGRST